MDEQNNFSDSEEESGPSIERQKRATRWKIYGWIVIALMVILIGVNLLDLVDPEVNRVAIPLMVAAYAVYVIFRRRV
ncbi:sulfite exporter TauE/SafE family protein [bacterium]|nr:sulfite exporter TauE/SafE family protein [bacterium]